MPYFFYIVRCCDDSLYCGSTTDVSRRVKEHNSDGTKAAKYTRAKRPVILVHTEEFTNKQEAMKREWEVKHWKKAKKEALVKGL